MAVDVELLSYLDSWNVVYIKIKALWQDQRIGKQVDQGSTGGGHYRRCSLWMTPSDIDEQVNRIYGVDLNEDPILNSSSIRPFYNGQYQIQYVLSSIIFKANN